MGNITIPDFNVKLVPQFFDAKLYHLNHIPWRRFEAGNWLSGLVADWILMLLIILK
jgi:hypothetical protein